MFSEMFIVHCSMFDCHFNPRSFPQAEGIALTPPRIPVRVSCCHETNFSYNVTALGLGYLACLPAIAFDRSATERHYTRPEQRGCAWRDCDVAFWHYRG